MTLVLPCADRRRRDTAEATSTASLPRETRRLSRGHVDGVEATPTSQVEAPFSRRVRAEPTSEKWKHSLASMIFLKKILCFGRGTIDRSL